MMSSPDNETEAQSWSVVEWETHLSDVCVCAVWVYNISIPYTYIYTFIRIAFSFLQFETYHLSVILRGSLSPRIKGGNVAVICVTYMHIHINIQQRIYRFIGVNKIVNVVEISRFRQRLVRRTFSIWRILLIILLMKGWFYKYFCSNVINNTT